MKAELEELGVLPSYSRPRVSNDNAFAESLLRTLKYRPEWPSSSFKSLEDARRRVSGFVNWYNTEHKHSKLLFVTPQERHEGKDVAILAQRQRVLEQARERTPGRWGTRPVRNCKPVDAGLTHTQGFDDNFRAFTIHNLLDKMNTKSFQSFMIQFTTVSMVPE